jgi:hypothetical protein
LIEYFGAFADRLAQARIAARPNFEWYPYDSLSNLRHIDRLLSGSKEPVLDRAREKGVLDLGCADGELALLFDSLGYRVTAIDNPLTNHNAMRGVRALAAQLGSKIDLLERDLDQQFSPPADRRYGLAVVLGLLYHLKNPFYVLELAARLADYALVSTRIARGLAEGAPLAYLLDAYELNDDNSNFWLFSEPALRRLFRRSHWECVEFFTEAGSDKSDERAFALLKSRFGLAHLELLDGWYEAQPEGWRWTAREFSVRAPDGTRRLAMRLYAPPRSIERLHTITLHAQAGDKQLAPLMMDGARPYLFDRRLEFAESDTVVRFSLDRALPPGEGDERELGIIVESIDFE